MKIIVDRIEENIATVELENGEMLNIPKILLEDAKEGDIVEIIIRKKETMERQQMIEEFLNDLFEN